MSEKYDGECRRVGMEGVRENLIVYCMSLSCTLDNPYQIAGVCLKKKMRVSKAYDGKCRSV